MSLFNFGKKNQQEPDDRHAHLMHSLEQAIHNRDEKALTSCFESIIASDEWFYQYNPNAKSGDEFVPMVSTINGLPFIQIFTDPSKFKQNGIIPAIAAIKISKVLDLVSQDLSLGGICINPYTEGYGMPRRQISKAISHCKNDSWGDGIPANIHPSDYMDNDDLVDFAIETLGNHILKDGDKIIDVNYNADACPHIRMMKNGKLTHITISVEIAPKIPEFSAQQRLEAMHKAKKEKAICMLAPIGFGSTDKERFLHSIALRGDKYYCRFTGFETIN